MAGSWDSKEYREKESTVVKEILGLRCSEVLKKDMAENEPLNFSVVMDDEGPEIRIEE
jgi:hypothetical protein